MNAHALVAECAAELLAGAAYGVWRTLVAAATRPGAAAMLALVLCGVAAERVGR